MSEDPNRKQYLKWLYYRDPEDPFDELGPSFRYNKMPDPPEDWNPNQTDDRRVAAYLSDMGFFISAFDIEARGQITNPQEAYEETKKYIQSRKKALDKKSAKNKIEYINDCKRFFESRYDYEIDRNPSYSSQTENFLKKIDANEITETLHESSQIYLNSIQKEYGKNDLGIFDMYSGLMFELELFVDYSKRANIAESMGVHRVPYPVAVATTPEQIEILIDEFAEDPYDIDIKNKLKEGQLENDLKKNFAEEYPLYFNNIYPFFVQIIDLLIREGHVDNPLRRAGGDGIHIPIPNAANTRFFKLFQTFIGNVVANPKFGGIRIEDDEGKRIETSPREFSDLTSYQDRVDPIRFANSFNEKNRSLIAKMFKEKAQTPGSGITYGYENEIDIDPELKEQGIRAYILNTYQEFVIEGILMNHCIGDVGGEYLDHVDNGTGFAISIRQNDKPRGTAYYGFPGSGNLGAAPFGSKQYWTLLEFFGPHDHEPLPQIKMALKSIDSSYDGEWHGRNEEAQEDVEPEEVYDVDWMGEFYYETPSSSWNFLKDESFSDFEERVSKSQDYEVVEYTENDEGNPIHVYASDISDVSYENIQEARNELASDIQNELETTLDSLFDEELKNLFDYFEWIGEAKGLPTKYQGYNHRERAYKNYSYKDNLYFKIKKYFQGELNLTNLPAVLPEDRSNISELKELDKDLVMDLAGYALIEKFNEMQSYDGNSTFYSEEDYRATVEIVEQIFDSSKDIYDFKEKFDKITPDVLDSLLPEEASAPEREVPKQDIRLFYEMAPGYDPYYQPTENISKKELINWALNDEEVFNSGAAERIINDLYRMERIDQHGGWTRDLITRFLSEKGRHYFSPLMGEQDSGGNILINDLSPQDREDIANRFKQIKQQRSEIVPTSKTKSQPWEIVIDGDMGYDVIKACKTWKEAHKFLTKCFRDFENGKLNPKEEDNTSISAEAKMQDNWALQDIKNAKPEERWSFHFTHDNHSYVVCLQPVGYKED